MEHKNVCSSSARINTVNESISTAKSVRKSPDDFEIIIKDHNTDLGKGSYGCVKLVRDKETR
jgi:hypothetical protein